MEIQLCLRAPANYQQTNSSAAAVKLAFFLSFSRELAIMAFGLWAQCDSEGIMDDVGG